MTHFLFFVLYALVAAVVFAVVGAGDARQKFWHGLKVFAEFVGVGLMLAWLCYFLP